MGQVLLILMIILNIKETFSVTFQMEMVYLKIVYCFLRDNLLMVISKEMVQYNIRMGKVLREILEKIRNIMGYKNI